MLVTAIAFVVSCICVSASVRRLLFVLPPDRFDLACIVVALRGDAGRARFGEVAARVAALPEMSVERQLFDAAMDRRDEARVAMLNEQLRELDFSLARWARVPRVCASIATSCGILLATTVLRDGLQDPTALEGDVRELLFGGVIGDALSVAMLGLAGAVACLALQSHTSRIAKEELRVADDLVARLETLVDAAFVGKNTS